MEFGYLRAASAVYRAHGKLRNKHMPNWFKVGSPKHLQAG